MNRASGALYAYLRCALRRRTPERERVTAATAWVD